MLLAAGLHAATVAAPRVAWAQAQDVRVHIDSPSHVELQQRVTRQSEWQTVCSSPCDSLLRPGAGTRIVGDGIRPSGAFMLSDRGGSITLTVRPTPASWLVGAIALTSVSGAVMAAGLVVAITALAKSGGDLTGTTRDWVEGGYTAAGIGVAGLLIGVLWIVGAVRSSVQMSGSASTGDSVATRSLPPGLWREAAPEQRLAPQAATVSLFSASF
jgi:hypothetical protein